MPKRLSSAQVKERAEIFAALGDETRLSLLVQLSQGEARSISSLCSDASISRQAITKHLRVLEGAGLVRNTKVGRESLFEFDPRPVNDAMKALELFSAQWDRTLERLRNFVED